MAARILGVLAWLSSAVLLVHSVPCCPDDMPMIALKEVVACQDLFDLSIIEHCCSWFAADNYHENVTEGSIQLFPVETFNLTSKHYCTGTVLTGRFTTWQALEDKSNKVIAMVCMPPDSDNPSEPESCQKCVRDRPVDC